MLLALRVPYTRVHVALEATRRNPQTRMFLASARLSESSRPSTATRTQNVMHRRARGHAYVPDVCVCVRLRAHGRAVIRLLI